jgi:hypothetical protein
LRHTHWFTEKIIHIYIYVRTYVRIENLD